MACWLRPWGRYNSRWQVHCPAHAVRKAPDLRLPVALYTELEGWHGGNFKVQCSANGVIEVFTARGEHHYSFAQDGHLIGSESLPEPFSSLPNEGQSVVVPTSPLLWVFSSPFLSWGVALLGFAGLAILKKMGYRSGVAG